MPSSLINATPLCQPTSSKGGRKRDERTFLGQLRIKARASAKKRDINIRREDVEKRTHGFFDCVSTIEVFIFFNFC
jgi:hypothetical protein